MGRQFQLETIPRFQWRVIVEVCSGLAQTKLDSTNFWVIECDVRFGVKGAVLTVDQSLPIYPDKQTFSESDGMSQMYHFPTFDPTPRWTSIFRRGIIIQCDPL